ncbi:MAG: diadenylate cyclase CdaA [Atribacterota bacterium]
MPSGFWYYCIEILIIYYVTYHLIARIRETLLFGPLKVLLVLFVVGGWSNLLGFKELRFFWELLLLGYFGAVLVAFQPEIRRIYFGHAYYRRGFLANYDLFLEGESRAKFIEEVVLTCQALARKKVGALLVLERNQSLRDFVQTGIPIDAVFSSELTFSVFLPDSPLHDGALIIRNGRIVAAGCILPLADSSQVDKLVGTRHRAGIGITEQTDALAVVVSGTTGRVSLAVHGKMAWDVEIGALKKMLKILYKKYGE